jgi:hypothetical protein
MVRLFYDLFSPWGEIEDVHFNAAKCLGFVKYKYRYVAEFSREAMLDQTFGDS